MHSSYGYCILQLCVRARLPAPLLDADAGLVAELAQVLLPVQPRQQLLQPPVVPRQRRRLRALEVDGVHVPGW